VTDDSAFKKQVRARMAEAGENYTTARRMVIAGRDPGQPPVALRVHLNPHVDLELTTEAARAYAAADEPGQRDMANRLLAEHIEMAGVATIAVSDDLGHVRVGIQAARPGVVFGHGGAELDRLRAELEELTGKPVQLNMVKYDGPPQGRKEIKIGPELTAD
jgi:hypothetical protein